MSVGSRSRRPSTAPLERGPNSPSAAGFIHRDIFAPSIPGGSYHHDEPVEGAFTTPKKHRKSLPSESFIPSAQRLERWNNKLGKYPFLGWLESHTGIPKLYLASAILFCLLLLVFRGTGLGVVSVCVGFLWPLHMSLKTIENCTSLFEEISGDNRHRHTEEQIKEKRGEIVGQLRQWLVYWVVYGLFNVFEQLSDFSLSWLPVYHPLKLVFLLWCFLPQYQGSQLVFDILVRPVLIRHESAIEQGVETASQAAMFSVGRVGRVVRAKSIQLSKAIQSSLDQSRGVAPSGLVHARVVAIESGQLGQISEDAEGEPHAGSDEGQSFSAFEAASRVAEASQRK